MATQYYDIKILEKVIDTLYDITFVDSKRHREVNFDNVFEVNIGKEGTIIRCKEKMNKIFCTAIKKDEYDMIIIKEVDN